MRIGRKLAEVPGSKMGGNSGDMDLHGLTKRGLNYHRKELENNFKKV